ncbi:ubiquitin carboxyl-terminal hydrolase CYLD [Parambassis ranga]|uniref:ubiquitinyl hydrolase 1 n=1 Tax=Parambassis ranga TaxID=210632 RepID=A0A6P7I1V6_9TELE|nr:ubiquitin carboxyl-terminal hydrolase CYLD-like [Parambassis ranga]XP_028261950.1 ubiquitin carboxyl-terminal hydrolase CYLD-like [Parambassis ranga]XP_028261951.1 ubiquitin carboxyl-terminal hydrolase CYLD-like [Parambassis ranga]
MEPRTAANEKFFIVIRGKSRKGFCRGCIGRVEGETQRGELMGLLYCGGSNAGSPKSGGMVRREDTYYLSRHQAQLLLFVSSPSKRLELLCNPQLFSAICELSQDDLVVVKHKKGHLPGLVKNLMQIGRKENKDDLHMLGFEVEFVEGNHNLSSKKAAPLSLFSAADITQVVPSYSVPLGLHWKDGKCGSVNRKAVTRIRSMPNIGSSTRRVTENHTEQSVIQNQQSTTTHDSLEVGSMVEVVSNNGTIVYGVVRWLGFPAGKSDEWAGIELDYEVNGCSDGKYGSQRYFTCKGNRALFVPVTKCSPDSRFSCSSMGIEDLKPTETSQVPQFEDSDEDAPPVPESEALSLFVGRMKGIQGHVNSCYLDATLFSLFSSSVTLDGVCQRPADTGQPLTCTLRTIINRLRRQGFVPAESVMNFRKQLGCDTFRTEEKDPEEFITVLFQKVLCMEPLLKLRLKGETAQGTYTFQIFLEKEQVGKVPTVQQLLETSCLSGDLKFETVPSCLIVQMPRFGNKYKMFSHIIPSMKLDITNLLHNSPRECFICGCLAVYECLQCLTDHKLQPGRIKQYCATCNTQVHTHTSRHGHSPSALSVPEGVASDAPVPRHMMQLFAVLCIQTSHYVSFVKYGPDSHSWLFFDSMADRCGDDQSGYSIPEIQACPDLGDFLCQPEEELARANLSQTPELVRRLLCDSYMFLYQNPATTL